MNSKPLTIDDILAEAINPISPEHTYDQRIAEAKQAIEAYYQQREREAIERAKPTWRAENGVFRDRHVSFNDGVAEFEDSLLRELGLEDTNEQND